MTNGNDRWSCRCPHTSSSPRCSGRPLSPGAMMKRVLPADHHSAATPVSNGSMHHFWSKNHPIVCDAVNRECLPSAFAKTTVPCTSSPAALAVGRTCGVS